MTMAWGKNNRDTHVEVDALIGPQVTIRGDVTFAGGLYVEGRVVGQITAEEGGESTLTLAENAVVQGQVRARVIVIAGRLEGDAWASERIELTPTARVNGNIHYQVVEMQAGAQLTGRLIHATAEAGEAGRTAPIAEPAAELSAAEA